MSEPLPPRLSELLEQPRDRRAFLRSSALSFAVPAALAACTRTETHNETAEQTKQGQLPPSARTPNASSSADTGVHAGPHGSSAVPGQRIDVSKIPFRRYDPTLPPLSKERTLRIHWEARDVPIRISPEVVVAAWTFEGDVPGPIVHVRQGDTIEFTLTNRGSIPHSMDFHAAQIDPKVAFRSVIPGESVTYTFKPRYAGAFLYHCGTAPVLMHIGAGMYGAIIVSPPTPLPPAREFVLVQSEFYLEPGNQQPSAFSYDEMLTLVPNYVAFNGRPAQYLAEPIRVKKGDRVRFYVVNAGPTATCDFHVVGEQFDTVYLGAPPGNAIHGVQTFSVPAGGGMVFELMADVAGEFPFVNHGFGHGQKGAIGHLVVVE